MTVLVTGGISKVSNQLAENLVEQGRNVVFLHDGSTQSIPSDLLKNSSFTLVNVSSVNEDVIKSLIETKNIKTVFDGSLTTSDVYLGPLQGARKLLLGITSVLDAIRKSISPPSLILISGEDVYGNSENRVETEPLQPINFVGSAQMSVEAMVHSYAVSYRIPTVIGRFPRVVVASKSELNSELKSFEQSDFVNILEISDAVQGILAIEKLAKSEKPAEVFNISNSKEFLVSNISESRNSKLSNSKIISETNWNPSDLSSLPAESQKKMEVIKPVFLVFGGDSELKTQFYEVAKADGVIVKESSIKNLQEASDKSVIDEINSIKPSHLVYFGNETDSFEGDCFTLRTNMATNLYFPWLLASLSERFLLHFTHFGNTEISQETSSLAVKGFTGKMLKYFENTLNLGPKIDENTLKLMKDRKTDGTNNN
uniref:NAD(P)-bd_dom domain-containing protein n=1 Tax=Caenorhabditis tropicalis TaxID=1561998 RepID=A0A1I7T0T4_9PELO